MSENIRYEITRRAEESGSRALDWSLSSFDKVGGKNTLRNVWSRLKGDNKVPGRKQVASQSSNSSDHKKMKNSINLSSTCIKLEGIVISSSASDDQDNKKVEPTNAFRFLPCLTGLM